MMTNLQLKKFNVRQTTEWNWKKRCVSIDEEKNHEVFENKKEVSFFYEITSYAVRKFIMFFFHSYGEWLLKNNCVQYIVYLY